MPAFVEYNLVVGERLYRAGEFSGIFADAFEQSGDLAEFFGQETDYKRGFPEVESAEDDGVRAENRHITFYEK